MIKSGDCVNGIVGEKRIGGWVMSFISKATYPLSLVIHGNAAGSDANERAAAYQKANFSFEDLYDHIKSNKNFASGYVDDLYNEELKAQYIVMNFSIAYRPDLSQIYPFSMACLVCRLVKHDDTKYENRYSAVYRLPRPVNEEEFNAVGDWLLRNHIFHHCEVIGILDKNAWVDDISGIEFTNDHAFDEREFGEIVKGIGESSNSRSPLFRKVQKILKWFPMVSDELNIRNKYQAIVCSLSEKFTEKEIEELIQPKMATRLFNFRYFLATKKFGSFETFFKMAAEFGWKEENKFLPEKELQVPDYVRASGVEIENLNCRYLTDSIGKFQSLSKANVLHSLQNTGKTELLTRLFKDKKIVYVAHRVELIEQVCRRFRESGIDITNYKEIEKGNFSTFKESVAIVINSLHKLDPGYYKDSIFIIDEVDQVIGQMYKDIMAKEKGQVIYRLEQFVKNSKYSLFSSADILPSTLNYITGICKPGDIKYFFNSFNVFDGKTLYYHRKKDSIINHIEKTLSMGEKVIVGGLTKETIKDLEAVLKARFPQKEIISITEETKRFETQKAILHNPREIEQCDAFLYTSVIGSGFDINVPFSKDVYLFADNNQTLNAWEALQLANRSRSYENLHLFAGSKLIPIDQKPMFRPTVELIREYRIQENESLKDQPFYEENFREDFESVGYAKLTDLMLLSENRISKNNLGYFIIQLCKERLYSVENADVAEYFPDSQTMRSEIVFNRKNTRLFDLTIAEDIEMGDAIRIKNSHVRTDKDSANLLSYQIKKIIKYDPGDKKSIKDFEFASSKFSSSAKLYSILKEYIIYRMNDLVTTNLHMQNMFSSDPLLISRKQLYYDIGVSLRRIRKYKYFGMKEFATFGPLLWRRKEDAKALLGIELQEFTWVKNTPDNLNNILKRFGSSLDTRLISNVKSYRFKWKDYVFLERCYLRWEDSIQEFFQKKNMLL
ncbi:hypothetical protein EHQ86_00325 [Leptospira yasudae]|nr:hypothetical protein EHQ86_00325 [Leptospira yasudae]